MKGFNIITNFGTKYLLVILYFTSILMLFPGLYKTTGAENFDKVFIHLVSFTSFFLLFYLLLHKKLDRIRNTIIASLKFNLTLLTNILFYGILAFICFHFILLWRFPFFDQMNETLILKAAFVRQNLYEQMPSYMGYPVSFLVKAIIPFFLLLLLHLKEYKKLIVVLIVSVFYLLNLLQKNFIVFAMLPSVIYLLSNRRYLFSIGYFAVIMSFIYILVYASNPQIRGHIQPDEPTQSSQGSASLALATSGLKDRILNVPGKVASVWFYSIPDKYPFLNGNGYNFMARLKGEEYVDYSKLLYKEYYPQYASKGLQGTVNTAGFIVDYANFGYAGLWFSGIFIAIWFVVIGMVFKNKKMLIACNFMNVMLLNSGYITTVFLSGGWLLTILLYLIYSSKFEEQCAE